MKFSIVIPNYNNERFLRATIESALAVVPSEIGEIVFVDDCSTDGSLHIAQEYKERIRIHKNRKNLGQELTTNKGLKLAKGEYAVILHSDDILHSNFYTDLSRLLDNNPSAVLAVGERSEIDGNGDILSKPAPFYDNDYLIPGREQAKIFLLSGFVPCQVMFRRKTILSFGAAQQFFNVNLDGLLWFKASLFGDVAYIRNRVCSYRKHAFSTTSSLNKSLLHPFEYYCTIREMFNFAQQRGVNFDENRPRAFNRIAELTTRFAKEIYTNGDVPLARRYLALAEAVDPKIRQNTSFLDTEKMIQNGVATKFEGTTRTFSYPPPPGSNLILDSSVDHSLFPGKPHEH